ncbi:Peroxidasin homolog [Seminavis robusta]|uniref:Peroxidasin homolog n=1 Tax=Seminavis robusta TaxID=568900 RepID=A0A9N8EDR6_9STRA|nr:Peroxidasin homolog [Seminavis robusta]|eukprot:Sro942_g222720.1 Peroxidasin homolog (644) ;mRNA; r:33955-36068
MRISAIILPLTLPIVAAQFERPIFPSFGGGQGNGNSNGNSNGSSNGQGNGNGNGNSNGSGNGQGNGNSNGNSNGSGNGQGNRNGNGNSNGSGNGQGNRNGNGNSNGAANGGSNGSGNGQANGGGGQPPGQQIPLTQWRSYDGSDRGDGLGEAETTLIRLAGDDLSYVDGDGEMIGGPNARDISNIVVAQETTSTNSAGLSDMLWSFGQFLDHDIDLTDSGPFGTAPVPITNTEDPFWQSCTEMEFSRSVFTGSPRQQINQITSFIDGSVVYGSDEPRALELRTMSDGLLKTSDDGQMLPFNDGGLDNAGGTSSDFYLAGDIRANEQIGLTALHALFVREHNRLAAEIKGRYPGSTDEQIYQLARKLVGATLQIITYKEFLPALIGNRAPNPETLSYDEGTDPSISNEFSTVAFRFGHTMLSPSFQMVSDSGHEGSVDLKDMFFNPGWYNGSSYKVDWVLKGFMVHIAQEIDTQIIDDVRNFLFGSDCLDLGTLNIQRGRDHGILHYNDVRESIGLSRKVNFANVTSDIGLQAKLEQVYSSVDEIDAWIGGLAEDHESGSACGELVGAILEDQFTRLITGDPFFWTWDPDLQNAPGLNGFWDPRQVTLAGVIQDNTVHSDIGFRKAFQVCSGRREPSFMCGQLW